MRAQERHGGLRGQWSVLELGDLEGGCTDRFEVTFDLFEVGRIMALISANAGHAPLSTIQQRIGLSVSDASQIMRHDEGHRWRIVRLVADTIMDSETDLELLLLKRYDTA